MTVTPPIQEQREKEKEALKNALEELNAEHPRLTGSAIYYLTHNVSDPKAHQIAAELYKVTLSRATETFRQSTRNSELSRMPAHIANEFIDEEMMPAVQMLDDESREIGRELVLVRAAYKEERGLFTEKAFAAASYYRKLGMNKEADEANLKGDQPHDISNKLEEN